MEQSQTCPKYTCNLVHIYVYIKFIYFLLSNKYIKFVYFISYITITHLFYFNPPSVLGSHPGHEKTNLKTEP
jgi:hypothetical protein